MKWTDESPAPAWPACPVEWLPGGASDADADSDADAARVVRVRVARALRAGVLAQLRAAGDVEDGGLLLGVPYHAPGRPGTVVRVSLLAAVPAPVGTGTRVSLRMEAEVWAAANAALADLRVRVPDARVVGWYHSHPGFGAFFSGTDRRTQAAFFREPYGVGWCIDPLDDSHAWYLGPESAPVTGEFVDNETN